ncbi:hypothetical protein VCR29J2_400007 [Vibrio coralliirubri]|nr:hypothetical protein VCR29J2_400007 [Vibrio coralliirubri]
MVISSLYEIPDYAPSSLSGMTKSMMNLQAIGSSIRPRTLSLSASKDILWQTPSSTPSFRRA